MRTLALLIAKLASGVAGMVLLTLTPLAAAQPSQGFTATPALESLALQQHQDSASYKSTLTNNTGQAVQVHVTTKDFSAAGTSGGIAFLDSTSGSHSLAGALSSSRQDFSLPAHQTQMITITLHGANTLAAGGHYAAVLYQISGAAKAGHTGNTVPLRQTVASLVFATAQGSGTYGIRLLPVQQSAALFGVPSAYSLVFANTGNVQATPRGYINLSGPFHEQIAKGIINPDSGLLLPDSDRLFAVRTNRIHRAWWPGVYTLRAYYRYDNQGNYRVATKHFFFVNFWLAFVVVCALTGAGVLLFKLQKRLPSRKRLTGTTNVK